MSLCTEMPFLFRTTKLVKDTIHLKTLPEEEDMADGCILEKMAFSNALAQSGIVLLLLSSRESCVFYSIDNVHERCLDAIYNLQFEIKSATSYIDK